MSDENDRCIIEGCHRDGAQWRGVTLCDNHIDPICPECYTPMTQLFHSNGTPDNLYECPKHCKSGPDQHVRASRTEPYGVVYA